MAMSGIGEAVEVTVGKHPYQRIRYAVPSLI
jgi:hypothetical protein